jgi:hypothetical protein
MSSNEDNELEIVTGWEYSEMGQEGDYIYMGKDEDGEPEWLYNGK